VRQKQNWKVGRENTADGKEKSDEERKESAKEHDKWELAMKLRVLNAKLSYIQCEF